MTKFAMFLATGAATMAVAAPAAAQTPYPYPYPQQTYPQYPGYQQPYGGNVIGNVINQLLGNRYSVTDRNAVSQCANAAMIQASNQYRGYGGYGQQGYGGYPQAYGQQGYGGYNPAMRVTAITNVERRQNGLRVSGLINSGMYGGYGGYGGGYQNQAYAQGDLSFRCNVDYRGVVTNVRIRRANNYRGY